MFVRRWVRNVAFGLVVCSTAVGCGAGRTTASGKVTFRGKPVTSGTVMLVAADKQIYLGPIQPDGTYSVPAVPVGPVAIGVSSPDPNDVEVRGKGSGTIGARPTSRKGDKALPEGWFPLPDKYADPNGSGLSGEVKSGRPFDIAIG